MNADAFEPAPSGLEELLKNGLIERCNLSPTDVASIMTARRTLQVGFAEAALHLGLVTREDIDETADLILRVDPDRSSGIIETALRRQAGTRIVAVTNSETVKASKQLILAHELDNERSERLRALRTELLLLSNPGGFANIFVLVSPGPGEGRSQLCAELAIAFAQLGRRTLLVDGDLRKPSLHFLFNASNQRGLTQALTQNIRRRGFTAALVAHRRAARSESVGALVGRSGRAVVVELAPRPGIHPHRHTAHHPVCRRVGTCYDGRARSGREQR
jgi:hypothetical protein